MKCKAKDCDRDAGEYLYCSITCACYDGAFSVNKGWLKSKEELDKDLEERNNGAITQRESATLAE